MNKTNAMRLLDAAGIVYEVFTYTVDENDLSGTHIADQIGLAYARVFKTLVARGDRTGPVVLCIPTDREIDLKKAARVTGNKRLELLHVKELLPLTGYIRGGCSPIGMKKRFPTYIDASALSFETITVSAGVRGAQLLLSPTALLAYLQAKSDDLTVEIAGNT